MKVKKTPVLKIRNSCPLYKNIETNAKEQKKETVVKLQGEIIFTLFIKLVFYRIRISVKETSYLSRFTFEQSGTCS